jgi:hypothetical protein
MSARLVAARSTAAAVAVLMLLGVGTATDALGSPLGPEGQDVASPRPVPASASAARPAKVLLAVGDIACDPASPEWGDPKKCQHRKVARIVKRQVRHGADWFLPLGDLQYESGLLPAFRQVYDRAFGAVKKVSKPVAGNHEWNSGANGYFAYFGARAGSKDKPWRTFVARPGWRVVLLDSNCERVGGCGPSSRQGKWLRATLNRSHQRCVVAAWHHPLQSSGTYGQDASVIAKARPLWRIADAGGVDIVLNGHDHLYERFAKLGGVQEFLVGTGGKSHYYEKTRHSGSKFLLDGHYGALRLEMKSHGRYSWRFLTTDIGARDRGNGRCTNTPAR